MRVCYLIQSHKNPEQIYRLVRTLKRGSPEAIVLVSHDSSASSLDTRPLAELLDVEVFAHGPVARGDFSVLDNYLLAVAWLFENGVPFDWLVNLSAQDYPVQPLAGIEEFLATTEYDGFVEHFDVLSPESHWPAHEGYSRYHFQYRKWKVHFGERLQDILRPIKIVNRLQPFFRVNISYDLMLGLRSAAVPFGAQFVCYGGSFFATLSRKCVDYLRRFMAEHPEVVAYYRRTSVPDESLLPTILVNNRALRICNDNRRYYDFRGTRNGHPKVLSAADFEKMVVSDCHFARKFDPRQDSRVLDRLDARIFDRVIQ